MIDRKPQRASSNSKLLMALTVVLVASLACAAAPALASFGIERFAISAREQNGAPDVQAGSHPYALTTSIILNQPEGPAVGDLKSVTLELPPGLVGDPDATPRCAYQEFIKAEKFGETSCSAETAVGVATSYVTNEEQAEKGEGTPTTDPVYNLVPPAGVAAEFGYVVNKATPVLLQSSVRTGSDYGVTTKVPEVNQGVVIAASKVTLWGVPAASSHNLIRGKCVRTGLQLGARPFESPISGLRAQNEEDQIEGPIGAFGSDAIIEPGSEEIEQRGGCVSEARPLPLLSNPTSCAVPRTAKLTVESWKGVIAQATDPLPEVKGCESLGFGSSLSVKPEKTTSSTPSALDVDVSVPQGATLDPTGLAEADVKDGTVVLPAGLAVNPSSADGLQSCSPSQIGFTGFAELDPSSEPGVQTAQFTSTPPSCPEPSKIANVKVKTPLLEGELEGAVYLASPQNYKAGPLENPFASLIAMYLVAEEPQAGVLVKLAGRVTPNPGTGQLTATIENSPQLPFSELKFEFFGGERAPLSTPALCNSYNAEGAFTPWSYAVSFPALSSFSISSGPGGSGCPSNPLPFAPSLAAGSTDINAGAFSPLTTTIAREDGQQTLHNVTLSYPPGVSAILTGVPLCGEAQANAGTCAAGSLIGEATASAGVGNDPYTVTGGRVYLTESYDGAPFGLSIVTPAQAGPFVLDEGQPVVVRAKVEINPLTAAIAVTTTGEIPHILDGIPLEIKRVNVTVNRPGFAINPTSCDPMSITGSIGASEGASAGVAAPFQLANCASLKFKPKVAVSTGAHSSKKDGASLKFVISYPKNPVGTQSWFQEAKFVIPKQLPAELKTIQQACLAATFEHDRSACPKHSVIGHAIVHTPVLPVPLEGPVYFVSFGSAKFPDAVMVLSGYGVNVELRGETYIHAGITSATFRNTPDVPFESIEVNLPTGEYSEFGTNLGLGKYDFCGHSLDVPTTLKAQNGLEIQEQTPVAVVGCPKAHKTSKKTHKKTPSKKK